ncbi:MAG: prolyl oligopeptidase family serine peptidase [Victivallales bacterium]|nr:prolyl oligopeptidase family serine peptidase [Victivallales bacterium]
MKKIICFLSFAVVLFAGDTVRPGLEGLESAAMTAEESELLQAMKEPFLSGMDVAVPLQAWFDGHLAVRQGRQQEAMRLWREALPACRSCRPLPPVQWGKWPDSTFALLEGLRAPGHPDVACQVVRWEVAGLKQYGVLMYPKEKAPPDGYPLVLYCHGAAFGVPGMFLGWLADLVSQGYVVIGPAMRGEPLFQEPLGSRFARYRCEGEIENLDGEVDDCLAMLSAAWKLPFVRRDEFAMVGHSFGAGVGLLTCARAGAKAKAVVSYDAWLVNPQRYCFDRMRRWANNWLSWEDYCNQPVPDQLAGLKKRSIVLNADMLQCPLLLFIGGAYEGSVFHRSHDDLCLALRRLGKAFHYEVVPRGGHNFVLYTDSQPAKRALAQQTEFLKRHYPPRRNEETPGLPPPPPPISEVKP